MKLTKNNFIKLGTVTLSLALSVALLTGCGETSSSTAESTSTDTSTSSEVTSSETTSEDTASEDTATAVDVNAIFDSINTANVISNPREITEMNLELDFLFAMEDIASFKGVASNDGDNSGLTLVIDVTEGKADVVKAALEAYMAQQITWWGNYPDFAAALEKAEEGQILQNGNTFVVVIESTEVTDSATLETALSEAFN